MEPLRPADRLCVQKSPPRATTTDRADRGLPAHPSLPLPSNVRVTNLGNHRSVVVRVNDRGPFVGGRVIDVSAKTAKSLGFYDDGLSKVKVEYVGRAQ